MPQPIGILGGTFDPVHNGHLHLATMLLKQLALTEVRFIPLNNPAHRTQPVAAAQQRLEMLQIATADHIQFKVDDCEIQQGGISYSIDTLKLIRQQLTQTPLCMILGMDSFNTLHHWKKWQSLLHYAHIVIVDRPNYNHHMDNQQLSQFMQKFITYSIENLHQKIAGYMMKLNTYMLDISSTQIRNDLKANKKIGSLLNAKVLNFIEINHLYKQT